MGSLGEADFGYGFAFNVYFSGRERSGSLVILSLRASRLDLNWLSSPPPILADILLKDVS